MPLNVLIVISDPIDEELAPLSFIEEWQSIARAFANQPISVTLTRLFPSTIENLFHTLHSHHNKFDILHFIGHGNTYGICLEDEVGAEAFIQAKELAQAVQESCIPLVVLNVCESEHPANLLSAAGLQTVIGMIESIYDDHAIMFAREIYSALAAGQSVERSLQRAKEVFKQIEGADQIPKVFGDISLSFSIDVSSEIGVKTIIQNMPNNNLLYSGSFFGRHTELRIGMQFIADPSCHVIQITGIGGVGKTALCSQLVQRSAWRFFGGILWIKGDEFSSSLEDLIVSSARGTLQVEDQRSETVRDITDLKDVCVLMNSRPILIIIDDVERLPHKLIIEVNLLLARLNPLIGSKVVICSQIPIVDMETHSNVGLLQVQNLDLDSAIQLTQIQSRLQNSLEIELLSENELKLLLNRIDCNPKMIQLMLGLAKAVGVDECKIAIEELSGPVPRMLNTLLEHIVGSLSQQDAKLLQLLALFSTFFTAEDIRGVFPTSSFQQSVVQLVERNLISFDPFSTKYHIHNLVRDFISSNIPMKGTYVNTYGTYVLKRLQYLLSLLAPAKNDDISSDIGRFLVEAKAAVKRLQDLGDNKAHETIIQIASVVRDYLHLQRQDWKSIAYFEQSAQNSCDALSKVTELGSVLTSLGAAEVQLGNADKGLKLCQEGITHLSGLGNPSFLSTGYGALGFVLRKSGNLLEAENAYLTAQRYARVAQSDSLESRHLSNLGNIYRQQHNLDKAKLKYEEALALARSTNDLSAIAVQLDLLGLIAREKNPDDALQLHEEAYNIKITIGDKRSLAITRNHLVATLKSLNRAKEALSYFDDFSDETENDSDSLNNWYGWLQRARLYRSIQDADTALTYYSKALSIAQNHNFGRGISICERGIALCYKLKGNNKIAYQHIQRAVEFSHPDDIFLPTLLEETDHIKQSL
jgi:tetratricopeptide (TPR) repeat protein